VSGTPASRRFCWLWLCLASILLAGCAAVRDFPAPNLPPRERLVDTAAADDMRPAAAGPVALVSHAEGEPANVLVLSGGAMNGAFPAGLLKGWSESGTRPQFDVVTGISTGALIAPFAFLGAECDAELERVYTTTNANQIYRLRWLWSLPWADALADSEPLRRRIKKEVTAEMLARIADEHRQGRRLYVGTTNLDTLQLVVWDLGAIAAGDDPQKLDLFQEVLLASCSIPGLLPPVPINVVIDGKRYSELHADGNVSASLFVPSQMLEAGSESSSPRETSPINVYVIVAGKLAPERATVARRLWHVSDMSLKGLIQSQMEGDLQRVYLSTRLSGARFHLAAIPQDLATNSDSLSFDQKSMRQIFDAGRQFGKLGGPWGEAPPGIDPAEWTEPRGGVVFRRRAGGG
jgi:predicted acylesterase/phospholipase RssA